MSIYEVNEIHGYVPRIKYLKRWLWKSYINWTVSLYWQGVTYDTGGADIKAGGVMAGMHRDKCGAAAVAGFFKVISECQGHQ